MAKPPKESGAPASPADAAAQTDRFAAVSAEPVAHKPASPLAVPIRALDRSHSRKMVTHLLALSPQDRYLRFGYSASNPQIERYVKQLAFGVDGLFGIFDRKLRLIAWAHLALPNDPNCPNCAEFGVSVLQPSRGRGYGRGLFERAVMHARNEGVTQLFIHALSENTAMLKIAHRAGAHTVHDGPESEAHLHLPPADFDSRFTELFNEQVARTDYQLKAQAKQFRSLLERWQKARQAGE